MKSLLYISLLTIFSLSINAGTTVSVISGKKTVKINDAVGDNIIKFLSSAPVENIEGNAKEIQGKFILDGDNLENSSGNISLQVLSMKTGLTKRDEHMYAKDWLDAASYPIISFDVKKLADIKISKSDNGTAEFTAIADGSFTMHGIAKSMKASIYIKYVNESDATRKKAAGDFVMIKASFKVPLKDFNIAGKQGIIGSKVGENIEITANLFGSTK
jgi:polyisoprenoid-binding protein YceI